MATSSRTNNRLTTWSRLFSRALIPVALLLFAAPFIGLLFYASTNADDYNKSTLSYNCASQPAVRTMTGMAWVQYSQGTGRWLTSFIQSFFMNKFNLINSYGWLLLLAMCITIGALAYFFANILRVPYKKAFLAAGLFYAIWLAGAAKPIDDVYWLTVALEYQVPLAFMLILAGLLSKPRQTVFTYTAIATLAIAIPAQHEIAGAFLVTCLVVGVVAARILKLKAYQWWLCLGLAVISFAVVMLSPGMAGRVAQGHKTSWTLAHDAPYAKRAISNGINWAVNPAVLLCAISLSLLAVPREDVPPESHYRPPKWLAPIGLGAMCVLLAEFASAEMTSGYGETGIGERFTEWFQFLFWLLLVCVILIGVPEISRIKFSRSAQIGISMLLLVSLFGSANFRAALSDLRGPARPWRKASVARLRQRGKELEFEPLPATPELFRHPSISKNPGCWVNVCMAVYLDAETVASLDPNENTWDTPGCGSATMALPATTDISQQK